MSNKPTLIILKHDSDIYLSGQISGLEEKLLLYNSSDKYKL